MAFSEDLSVFFADFGVSTMVGGAAVVGIFDKTYLQSMGIVTGSNPVLLCQSSDVATAAEDTAVTVDATSYKVISQEPDGTGLTLLQLELA